MAKIQVSVIALYHSGGDGVSRVQVHPRLLAKHKVFPLRILTARGEKIHIDRIQDIYREASTKAGGIGEKYFCLATLGDSQRGINIWKDGDEWYMEDEFAEALAPRW
jgi:hypothetical protein